MRMQVFGPLQLRAVFQVRPCFFPMLMLVYSAVRLAGVFEARCSMCLVGAQHRPAVCRTVFTMKAAQREHAETDKLDQKDLTKQTG